MESYLRESRERVLRENEERVERMVREQHEDWSKQRRILCAQINLPPDGQTRQSSTLHESLSSCKSNVSPSCNFRSKNKEIDDLKEIIEELMNEHKAEKQLKVDQQEVEMLSMTKSLYSERCKFDRLKNEHNSLKVL